ncbi:MAG: MBL fold metallo-hydrolase [Oscillospiraceae bacterium]|nr:MBL fold metallo-hydrolase [Oscillospiraceae bacterium]
MANFTSEKIIANTFVIRGAGCDSYLLAGEKEAVMIDSGMSEHNIREFAEGVCGRAVRCVVNTHSHFDHTAGNGFFDIVYATEGISRSAKNTFGADPKKYPLDYDFTIIQDGDVIGSADRPLKIIELDCHSPGNIAILDIQNRMLFPGDELDTGQVLLLPGYAEKPGQLHSRPASSVETYLRAIQKLVDIEDEFDFIYPAHNGAPIGKEWLSRYYELARRILGGYEGSADCSGRGYDSSMAHFPLKTANYRRGEWDGASLIYCADLIRDSDYQKGQPEPATELHRISRIPD